jgi:hypothetical protein
LIILKIPQKKPPRTGGYVQSEVRQVLELHWASGWVPKLIATVIKGSQIPGSGYQKINAPLIIHNHGSIFLLTLVSHW